MRENTISLTGNEAAALAIAQANPQLIAGYPITPVTEILHILSQNINNKKMISQLILPESEHSAISACLGASACNMRTATATASQGLLLMHEVLGVVSGLRLPVVMIVGNRAVSAPLNIHNDHSDTMAIKDSGWLQFYAESVQEIYDLTLLAFKLSEDENINLPIMVCMDGFITTHELNKIKVFDNEFVNEYLPKKTNKNSLFDFDDPKTMGHLALPKDYQNLRLKLEQTIKKSKEIIKQEFSSFEHKMNLIEVYNPLASNFFVCMASACGTIKETLKKDSDWGLLKISVFRPFPNEEIIQILKGKRQVIVLDKSLTLKGNGGHLYEEVRSALYDQDNRPKIYGEIYGLGGKPFYPKDIKKIVKKYD